MKHRYFLLLIALAILPLNLFSQIATQSQPQKKVALVIGNGNYASSILANPENDARSIATVLQQLGFSVYKYENLDQKQMKRAIDDFGLKLKGNDIGLFFYAGHGIQSKGYNYLIPVDAQLRAEADVEYDCVQADRILAKMEGSGTKVNIIILDACRNNPFERSWTRSETGKGLAFMNAPSGTLIAYSTSPGSTALDGSGKNSPYTAAILESILNPNVTITQMFQNVGRILIERTNKQQTPWIASSLIGDFYFMQSTIIDKSNISNVEEKKSINSESEIKPILNQIESENKPLILNELGRNLTIDDLDAVKNISGDLKSYGTLYVLKISGLLPIASTSPVLKDGFHLSNNRIFDWSSEEIRTQVSSFTEFEYSLRDENIQSALNLKEKVSNGKIDTSRITSTGVKREVFFDSNGLLTKTISSYQTQFYLSTSNTSTIRHSPLSKTIGTFASKFDYTNNNLVKEYFFVKDKNSEVFSALVREYTLSSNKIISSVAKTGIMGGSGESWLDENGFNKTKETYEYSNNGDLIKLTFRDDENVVHRIIEYIYYNFDDKNNWTRRIKTDRYFNNPYQNTRKSEIHIQKRIYKYN